MQRQGLLAALTAGLMLATAVSAQAAPVFNRVASFPVELNKADGSSSAEIIAASEDGNTLVYSDSPGGGIGFVGIVVPHLLRLVIGPGHRLLLIHLQAQPLLDMELRVGQASGALLAWPLLQAAQSLLEH